MDNRVRLFGTIVILLIVIAAVVFFVSASKDNSDVSQTKWPHNDITKKIPEYKGEIYKVSATDRSTAVFAENVTEEQADDYCKKLTDAGYSLSSENYPKTASAQGKFITIAYDKNSKKFSVTVATAGEESQTKIKK